MYDNPLATSTIEFTTSAIADNCGGYADGAALVSKEANVDFDAMANALTLETSFTYSLKERNQSFPDYHYSLKYESNWKPDSGFTRFSDLNAFICVK